MKALEYFDKLLELKHTKEISFLIQNRFAFAEHFAEHQNKELIESVKNMTKVIGEQKETIDLFRVQNKELIEEKEGRIKELKNGSVLRIIVSDINKENEVLYSIIDALDGELIQMDIDKVKVFINRVRYYLNILKTNKK